MRKDQQRECPKGRRQQIDCADAQDVALDAAADVLTQQKTNPTGDDEEHQPARIATGQDIKCQPIHGGDDASECEYGVGHDSCASRVHW